MRFVIVVSHSKDTCQSCNARQIVGKIVIHDAGYEVDTELMSGCAECIGEKVKTML